MSRMWKQFSVRVVGSVLYLTGTYGTGQPTAVTSLAGKMHFLIALFHSLNRETWNCVLVYVV